MIQNLRAGTNQDYFKMRIDWISELLSNGHRHCWDGAKNLNRNYFHVEGVTAPCLYWELSKAAFELFWFCAKAWGQEVLLMTPIKYLIDILQILFVGAECAKICCRGSYWQGPCCSGKKVWSIYLDLTGYSLSLLQASHTTGYFNSWKAHLGSWLNLGV